MALTRNFRQILRTRPIFHSSDAAIRGHMFCSFLALAMQKHLDDLLRETGVTPEWKELLRDLDRLQNVRLEHRGADWLVRTDATPNVAALFLHVHIVLPLRAFPLGHQETWTELGRPRSFILFRTWTTTATSAHLVSSV